jgi:hypothetical protein
MMAQQRYADPETLEHIIELRQRLRETERQRDKALDRCIYLDKILWKIREDIIMLANGKLSDDERNC